MAHLAGLGARHLPSHCLPLHCRPAERPGERIYFRFNDVAAGQQQLLALNAEVSFQMAPDPYDNADRASKLQVMTKQFDPSRLKMQGGETSPCSLYLACLLCSAASRGREHLTHWPEVCVAGVTAALGAGWRTCPARAYRAQCN